MTTAIETAVAAPSAVTVNVPEIVRAVKDATVATKGINHVPAMTGIRLSACAGILEVAGFNFDLSITRRIRCDGDDFPPVLVPAARLKASLAGFDVRRPVNIRPDGDAHIVITQERKRAQIETINMDDYSNLPATLKAPDFGAPGNVFALTASKVAAFAGRSNMLPMLTCVHMEYVNKTLWVHATDRFRAAKATFLDCWGTSETTVDVPNFATFGGLFVEGENVSVTVDAGIVFFDADTTSVTQRCIEGSFPAIQRLFTDDWNGRVTVDQVAFLKSLKFVGAGAAKNVRVSLDFSPDAVRLATDDAGTVTSDILPAETVTADGMSIRFNQTFLKETFTVFGKTHPVTCAFVSSTKPATFTSESVPGFRVLMMPSIQAGS